LFTAIPNITAGLVLVRMLLLDTLHLIGFNILLGGRPSPSKNVVLKKRLSKLLASLIYATQNYGKHAAN